MLPPGTGACAVTRHIERRVEALEARETSCEFAVVVDHAREGFDSALARWERDNPGSSLSPILVTFIRA